MLFRWRGETNPISYDAKGSAVKDELEGLPSIATVWYMRAESLVLTLRRKLSIPVSKNP